MIQDVQIGGRTFAIDTERLPADLVVVAPGTVSLLIEGRSITLHWHRLERSATGAQIWIAGRGGETVAEVRDPRQLSARRHFEQSGRVGLKAPMSGKVVRIAAPVGTEVEAGQPVLVLEAMKMQNEVRSPKKGVVVSVAVEPGQVVATGQLLAAVE